ncbi:LysM domain-containing protein [Aneurinibacillus thermoaerophilus]|uniref:LysM domain-containing protein n=1 Tax=Aneurinibacillus thermoaerophilus TaxID=143495 RepID=A0A1G8FCJ0_ANETH|nr:LysM peptidoglycan-binding domain-containing protein [Aneurinibacillus thermoaerophilus]SDH79813.1 LysM domain-containing protein [Aneurinibacillus thermoaerophilus]
MLIIGDVKMTGLAAPENFPLGGEQVIATHKLPGGGVINQPRGFFPVLEYGWEGTFDGPDAHQKFAKLEKYCQSGESVQVSFHTFSFYCFVQKIEPLWVRKDWLDFTINLKRDPSKTVASTKTSATNAQKTSTASMVAAKRLISSVVSRQTIQQKKPKKIIHVVVKGETLRKIAQKYYKDPDEFEKIYQENKAVIGNNPNKIKEGMKLVIPL